MTDHLQQTANEQAQREYGDRIREAEARAVRAELQVTRLLQLCVLLACISATCGALAIRDLAQGGDHAVAEDDWRRAWMTAHDELDQVRQALDGCVDDLLATQPHARATTLDLPKITGGTAGTQTFTTTQTLRPDDWDPRVYLPIVSDRKQWSPTAADPVMGKTR